MENNPKCPKCNGEYVYFDGVNNVCPDCGYEFSGDSQNLADNDDSLKVIDSNGTPLQNGDNVVVIKDLKVKGTSNPIKQGTMVKNITLIDEAGHNISCKITGFGAMNLKSEFVKKA